MNALVKRVERLKNKNVRKLIDERINEFRKIGRKTYKEIFVELCFCILTANFNAEKTILIQEKIGDGFLTLSQRQLAKKLKNLGYRYPNIRARYIVEARKHDLMKILKTKNPRKTLVENVKGIGCKEASHFLRNIGYENFAILDFHILDILARHGLIKPVKVLSKKKYIKIEEKLKKIACKLNLTLAELDLYLWYLETGRVLK